MLSLNKPFTHIQPVARLSCAAVIIAAIMVNFGCSSDSGKANRTNPVPIVDSFTEEVVVYNGPTPISQSVLNFKVNFWDNVALQSRCGGCHVEGDQQPAFARADDINLAHDLVLNDGWILLSEPASSPLVEKVASGHQCWLSDPSACEEKFVEWIRAWADDSGVEVTESSLRVPEVQEVSASLTYSETSGGFQTHVYPLLADYCSDCHRADAPQAPVQPFFAATDVDTAYAAAQTKMLFNVTPVGDGFSIDASRSRLVVRLREEAHSCWNNNCVSSANAMEQALEAFAATLEMSDLDSSLVTSKAMRVGDGTAISQGGRVETNAIAVYPFKAGRGSVAVDYAFDRFPPGLDLNLSGDVTWVSNWGVRFNNGRAQGSVSASEKLRNYISQTGEYSIEAWVVPANVTQDGPARIVSYSGSDALRNFTLGQTLYNYNFFTRTNTTDANGTPTVDTPDADEVLQATLQHVVAAYNPLEGRKIYVNGEEVGMEDTAGVGNFNDWDDSFALVLGNETDGLYPWKGTIRFLAIHNRALTLEDTQTNYDVGVGQKILLAFSISEHVNGMSDAYIVFQVEQFDDYSYLFNQPYFFSFSQTPASDVVIQGLRIGVNGREAAVGQAFANMDQTITSSNFSADGVPLSTLGTIIQSEKGASQDQFFLSFDRIGQSTYARPVEPEVVATEPEDLPAQPKIGIRTFAEINASLSAMTGIAVTDSRVRDTYLAVEQQMPSSENVNGFLVAHQMGITQLAVKYCNTLANDSMLSAGFFPNFNNSFDSAGRSALVAPLMEAMLAHNIVSEGVQLANQPLQSESEAQLNALMDTMTSDCAGNACSAAVTRNTITAVCAAAMGSAVMLIQ